MFEKSCNITRPENYAEAASIGAAFAESGALIERSWIIVDYDRHVTAANIR